VAEPPARAQAAVESAGPVAREGTVGPYDFTVTFDPARAGANTVHVYLLDSNGQLAEADEVTMSGSLPDIDIGPLDIELSSGGPGHVTGVAELPLPGDWLVTLDVRKGEFDQWSAVMDVPIGKDT
jgi:copper transport protein